MLTAEQKELRKHGIGSSEIAAVCGLNPFQTPTDVWLVKTGLKAEFEGNEATEIGEAIEFWITEYYCKKNDIDIDSDRLIKGWQTLSPPMLKNSDAFAEMIHAYEAEIGIVNKKELIYNWQLATPDYLIDNGLNGLILEIKNVGPNALRYWDDNAPDGVPIYVITQVQWQMFVTGIKKAVVCALLGGVRLRWWEFDYNEDMAQKMFKIAELFWHENVLKNIPPDETDAEYIKLLHPKDNGEMLEATDTTIELAKDRIIADTNWKAAKLERDKIDNQLKAIIGPASGIDGICTYKADKNGIRRFNFNYGGE